jgi:hypothetical protein
MKSIQEALGIKDDAQFLTVTFPPPERIRLNTAELQRLIPLARGLEPERLKQLADEAPGNVGDALDREALKTIWTKVVKAETGLTVQTSAIRWKGHDVEAVRESLVIWRLSDSAWAIRS